VSDFATSEFVVILYEKITLNNVYRAGVKGVIILTPILGINWLFGLLAVNKQMLVFEFLFVIINSLQGLLIFLAHCVGSSEVCSESLCCHKLPLN